MAKSATAGWTDKSAHRHKIRRVGRAPRVEHSRAARGDIGLGAFKESGPAIGSAKVEPTVIAYVDPAGHAYIALLGLKDTGPSSLVETVRKGLPFRTFEKFVSTTLLSSSDAADLVNIPARTLTRRKQSGRLEPDESDRLLRASRVLGRAIELFEGDREAAKQWLARPQRALGGATPFQLARTEVGALAVERLVDQLEHGVFV